LPICSFGVEFSVAFADRFKGLVNDSCLNLISIVSNFRWRDRRMTTISVSGPDRLVMTTLNILDFVSAQAMTLDLAISTQIAWSGPFLASVTVVGTGLESVVVGGELTAVNNGFLDRILASDGVDTLELSNLSLTAYDFFALQFAGSGKAALMMVLNGNDQVFGTVGRDKLLGGNGNDQLIGYGGSDVLRGGAGQDTLFGDRGNDILWGGKSPDAFVFNLQPEVAGTDTIRDFHHREDLIALNASSFGNLGNPGILDAAHFTLNTGPTTDLHGIIYDQPTGRIWWDADGTGPASQILFAKVTPGMALTAHDFLVY
jgi:Ca2+-binding RTX toxin-like protein